MRNSPDKDECSDWDVSKIIDRLPLKLFHVPDDFSNLSGIKFFKVLKYICFVIEDIIV